MKSKKVPLRDRLIGEGWFDSEDEAARWAMLGRIAVDGRPAAGIHIKVGEDDVIRVKEYYKRKYVSKGGLKLEKAICEFRLDLDGAVVFDCGASTGGFTDCALRHGARLVYAVDAGHGQLAGKLAGDSRVRNMEKTNIGDAALLSLDPKPDFATLDLSYLSLKKAVPAALDIIKNGGTLICLVKPIFEVDDKEIRRSGRINDAATHMEILSGLLLFFSGLGLAILGMTYSPVRGNGDTVEYLIGLTSGSDRISAVVSDEDIERCVGEAFNVEKFDKNGYTKDIFL